MRDLNEIRRDNLRAIMKKRGGSTKVAAQLGYKTGSFFSQMLGPTPTRDITEKSARRYEAALGLPSGTLDKEHLPEAPAAAPPSTDVALISDVIRLLGSVLADEKMNLPPQRFADVAALALEDAAERGGKPRESHVRSLVRLLK
jgi:hypothetical protein